MEVLFSELARAIDEANDELTACTQDTVCLSCETTCTWSSPVSNLVRTMWWQSSKIDGRFRHNRAPRPVRRHGSASSSSAPGWSSESSFAAERVGKTRGACDLFMSRALGGYYFGLCRSKPNTLPSQALTVGSERPRSRLHGSTRRRLAHPTSAPRFRTGVSADCCHFDAVPDRRCCAEMVISKTE